MWYYAAVRVYCAKWLNKTLQNEFEGKIYTTLLKRLDNNIQQAFRTIIWCKLNVGWSVFRFTLFPFNQRSICASSKSVAAPFGRYFFSLAKIARFYAHEMYTERIKNFRPKKLCGRKRDASANIPLCIALFTIEYLSGILTCIESACTTCYIGIKFISW